MVEDENETADIILISTVYKGETLCLNLKFIHPLFVGKNTIAYSELLNTVVLILLNHQLGVQNKGFNFTSQTDAKSCDCNCDLKSSSSGQVHE